MPDSSQSPELVRSRITNPKSIREIETLEIVQPHISIQNEQLDVVFVIDITGSMDSIIASVKDSLNTAAATLTTRFSSVKFGLVTFKDEDELFLVPSQDLQTLEEIQTYLNSLVSSGGGDELEAGYLATVTACNDIQWRQGLSVLRAVVLVSDEGSHERGATKEQAISALLANNVTFYYTYANSFSYNDLAISTGGQEIPYSFVASEFAENLSNSLLNIKTVLGKDPIYLVNDGYQFDAKTENELDVSYLPRAFEIGVSVEGTTGVRTINLTVDNTDLQVSKYLASAINNNLPIEVVYRLYLSSDPVYPQNNPPLRVFLSNVEVSGNTVAGELTWIDLSNAAFPNAYYSNDNFPSL